MVTTLGDITTLEKEISVLDSLSHGVETLGLNKTSLYILHKTELLKSTALGSLGLESITPDTQRMALEAIDNEAKEKSAQWSAKILSFFKDGSGLILDKITKVWDSVKAKAELLLGSVWDNTKLTRDKIAAHPYKTILIALAAAAATFAVISFVGTSLPAGVVTNGQLHSFMLRLETMYHKIKLPFGKITTTAVSDGRLIFATVETVNTLPTTGTVASLGWTKNAAKAIYDSAGKLVSGATKGVTVIWNRILKPSEKVVARVIFAPKEFKDFVTSKTGMRTAGWLSDQVIPALYYSVLFKLVNNVYQITKEVVIKTIQMIKDTFSSLSKVLT